MAVNLPAYLYVHTQPVHSLPMTQTIWRLEVGYEQTGSDGIAWIREEYKKKISLENNENQHANAWLLSVVQGKLSNA